MAISASRERTWSAERRSRRRRGPPRELQRERAAQPLLTPVMSTVLGPAAAALAAATPPPPPLDPPSSPPLVLRVEAEASGFFASLMGRNPSPRKARLRTVRSGPAHTPAAAAMSHVSPLSASALGGVVLGFQNLLDPSSPSPPPPPPSSAPIAAGSSPVT